MSRMRYGLALLCCLMTPPLPLLPPVSSHPLVYKLRPYNASSLASAEMGSPTSSTSSSSTSSSTSYSSSSILDRNSFIASYYSQQFATSAKRMVDNTPNLSSLTKALSLYQQAYTSRPSQTLREAIHQLLLCIARWKTGTFSSDLHM